MNLHTVEEKTEEPKLKSDMVFVYGSLKQGFHLHGCMKDATFIMSSMTKKASFNLFTPNDAWPAITMPGKRKIKGEVYKVTEEQLKRLDEVEGVPHLYERKLVKIRGIAGLCNVYIAGDRLDTISKRLEYKSPRIVYDRRDNTLEWVNI